MPIDQWSGISVYTCQYFSSSAEPGNGEPGGAEPGGAEPGDGSGKCTTVYSWLASVSHAGQIGPIGRNWSFSPKRENPGNEGVASES